MEPYVDKGRDASIHVEQISPIRGYRSFSQR